ncbi:MAG TPA: FAD-dependent oxidoreductase [Verrucomicrobiales bacterium]|nr:FAD-dependent oxidoreductase [Verrucomicrobiales bacterium]
MTNLGGEGEEIRGLEAEGDRSAEVWMRAGQLDLPLEHGEEELRRAVLERLGTNEEDLLAWKIRQRAIDARRRRPVRLVYTVDVQLRNRQKAGKLVRRVQRGELPGVTMRPDERYRFLVENRRFRPAARRPVIVGTGPCGLFAGLLLARLGLRPLLLERGKAAGARARDVTRFWRTGEGFDPESNVQFGEGGAGTFSDGKLYTQIRDREGRNRWILEQLAEHGAPSEILAHSRPHIGTDKLIRVLRNLRSTLLDLGAEIRFETRATGLVSEGGAIRGLRLAGGAEIEAEAVILAVGHSARDVFAMLEAEGVPMEAKPFSVGVRIEHPQEAVDRRQYGAQAGHPLLGAADYRFVDHGSKGRAVYSFCMCPGGLVVGATSEAARLATNGMSSYARDRANANAGFMVEVRPEDLGAGGALAGMEFQRRLEEKAFLAGGGGYRAPAQLLEDFLRGRASRGPGGVEPSFRPGVVWGDLGEVLPAFVIEALREATPRIERRLPGFNRADAVLTAVESRSSAPLRVARGVDMQSPSLAGLYPAGEGAGYAGGILSAAADGLRVAEALAARYAG